jgi:phosphatidylinositol alpha-1,6-mannosyltransferase
MANNTQIVLVARTFPPQVGGMQTYMYQLYSQMKRESPTYKIVLGGSQRNLIWWYPLSFIRAFYRCLVSPITHLHVGDGVMAPVGIVVASFSRLFGKKIRTSISVHGLDLTWKCFIYQRMVRFFVPRYWRVICNSSATLDVALKVGVPRERCRVILLGAEEIKDQPTLTRKEARQQLEKELQVDLEGRKLLLTVGRLVKRKGVAWFIENGIPHLSEQYLYLIAGDGPERRTVEHKIAALREADKRKVRYLGRVSHELKQNLYRGSDIFLMPNQVVPGDMEGFGLVAVEAGLQGLPVVASRLEGIRDAVVEGETGFFVDHRDASAFEPAFEKCRRLDREQLPQKVLQRCSWESFYSQYQSFLEMS